MPAAPEAVPSVPVDEAVDIAGAAALLDDERARHAPDIDDADADAPAEAEADTAPEATADETGPDEAGPDGAASDDGPPDFWSADDKAAWREVPEPLRPVLRKYEQQRIAFVNEKVREAARAREEAAQIVEVAASKAEQAATWWAENGPAFQKAFADKWAGVDWHRLAGENPSEWARLKQQRDDEAAMLHEANRRGEADREVARARAHHVLHQARQAEHAKLRDRHPEWFGDDKATETYRDLGRFLLDKGIAPDRINAIHEAPIIELALAAMRFEKAQKQASTAARSAAHSTARTTPTRIAPGPAGRAGNRATDSARQVGERFRQGGGASIADAAELIRLSGL